MGPRRVTVTVAVTVVGLLRDPAFHVAKCTAEVSPGLQPQRQVGSSGERCGLEINKQRNACAQRRLLGRKYSESWVSAVLWRCQAQAQAPRLYGLPARRCSGRGVPVAASLPPCSYTSKKFYSCATLYKMSCTSQLCPTYLAAYDKSLNAALSVQMRKQKAANITGFHRLS